MILSKQNLLVVEITKIDKKLNILNSIHAQKDGTTIARNNKVMLLVSPVDPSVKKKLKDILPAGNEADVTISADTINEVIKALPADREFKGMLEHCSLLIDDKICFNTTDGRRERTINGKKINKEYVPYREALRSAFSKIDTGNKIVLDLNRLILLLNTIKKICPDSTKELPVYIEFTDDNDIILRCINPKNGQRVIALMTSYKGIEGRWLNYTEWEKQYFEKEPKKLKLKLKLKKRLL